jgi:hypothetical protein
MNDDDKYGKYEDDPKAWLEKINQAHWEQTQAQAKLPKSPKKTVWARVSMEIDVEEGEEGYDDESLMDIVHDELVEYGFTIDDMGMMNPTDLDKFYPETEETK